MHVFLGYPFKLTKTHRDFIKDVCKKRGLGLKSAEDHFAAEGIWGQIQDDIDNAFFAMFDLTGYNHNVLLELGYAIGRDRDVIILLNVKKSKPRLFGAKDDPMDGFPSDLQSVRRIQYADKRELERKLLEALDGLLRNKTADEQFWLLLKNFLRDGSQDTKSISTFMEKKLEFSYQMTRNRLERHRLAGELTKKIQGKVSIYGLSQSALH
ncbi:MAG TPA: hypothetical protein VGO52_02595 [Hyphomonadaceae bacterium]|nr:hypothetical protein [Hyphomonadaceae bacterium]